MHAYIRSIFEFFVLCCGKFRSEKKYERVASNEKGVVSISSLLNARAREREKERDLQ
jgi:hypothetical protein